MSAFSPYSYESLWSQQDSMNVMGIHFLLPFLWKLKSVYGPAWLLLFHWNKFFLEGNWQDSERFKTAVLPKNISI